MIRTPITRTRITRTVATLGHVGFIPGAAGTWASLAALATGYGLHVLGSFPLLAAATVVAVCVGWWATGVETDKQDDLDPAHIVIDEVAGQWIALWPLSLGMWHIGAPPTLFPWPGWVSAFLLFRLLDVRKPWPISWADRQRGPTGVMLDDILAGLFTAVLVTLMAGIAHGWLMARGGA